MAKRANRRRTNGKRKRTTNRSAESTPATASTEYVIEVKEETLASTCKSAGELLLDMPDDPPEDLLDDPFFYESPFPPEVELEALEPPPAVYTPAMIARRRKLRTFVAMVVGAAATIVLLGLGQTMW